MKSLTTLRNNQDGYLIGEAMIAFFLMTLFLVSSVALHFSITELENVSKQQLTEVAFAMENISSTTLTRKYKYGNHSTKSILEPIEKLTSNTRSGWGSDNCLQRLPEIELNEFQTIVSTLNLGAGNLSTDMEIRNGIMYLTSDSATASQGDFFIIDASNLEAPDIVSSLNTGPGLSSIEVAGPFVYTANLGSTHQLQIIDIRNRTQPSVVSRLRLPLPRASSTAPFATSIFYSRGKIYLGTEKWEGPEFSIIDVSNPQNPIRLGGFETDTQINDIFVHENVVYLAASNQEQLLVLNIENPTNPYFVNSFSPTGWETQTGKNISYFEDSLLLGRTNGGVNRVDNHEIFIFSTTTPTDLEVGASKDNPGGVYGILLREPYLFLTTRSPGQEFQVWRSDLEEKIGEFSLSIMPRGMKCDNGTLYFITGQPNGFSALNLISP